MGGLSRFACLCSGASHFANYHRNWFPHEFFYRRADGSHDSDYGPGYFAGQRLRACLSADLAGQRIYTGSAYDLVVQNVCSSRAYYAVLPGRRRARL